MSGPLPDLSVEVYEHALAVIDNLSDDALGDVVDMLFPDDVDAQFVGRCWLKSVQLGGREEADPKTIPANLWGDSGIAKTATIAAVAKGLGTWLSATVGSLVPVHLVTRTLAGVESMGEVLGFVHFVLEPKRETVLFPFVGTPQWGDRVFALFFFDDANRGGKATLAPFFQLASTRELNGYAMPRSVVPCAAMNPSGRGHAVTKVDVAQYSRFGNWGAMPKHKGFLANLVAQRLPMDLVAFADKYRAKLFKWSALADLLPRDRPLNYRNYAMFCHLDATMRNNERLRLRWAESCFGHDVNFRELMATMGGDVPMTAEEVLGVDGRGPVPEGSKTPEAAWAEASVKIEKWTDRRLVDIIALTAGGVIAHVNAKSTVLTDKQHDVFCQFLMALPKDLGADVLRRTCEADAGAPRWREYGPRTMQWRTEAGDSRGAIAKAFGPTMHRLRERMLSVRKQSA